MKEAPAMYTYTLPPAPPNLPLQADDGHGDYNRSYERNDDDFDYADYSPDRRDNNFRNFEKKRRKTNKEIIEDMLKRWDWKSAKVMLFVKLYEEPPRERTRSPGGCFLI